ncbi:hypothetical protein SteCoe_38656 [Stentor coeruleus]|uniref:Uncharacterized protein n=1 Tax=Stentor coeruleus TaxID=5963 RepID=A0A1R2AL68_9CILI|nr:hypothetical protein SteCoe_38656 [Stentor coeruleus]
MAKSTPNIRFENFTENQIFCTASRSPSFQESYTSREYHTCEYEAENTKLRQRIKILEENWLKIHEEVINREISRMNEFQEKEKKFKSDYEELERKFSSLLWKIEAVQKENISLQKQLKEYTESQEVNKEYPEKTFENKNPEFLDLLIKCRDLESELNLTKQEKKCKALNYKKKQKNLEAAVSQLISEKEQKIQDLEEKLKEKTKKSSSKSPLRSMRTPRRNSTNHLQEITNTIVALEKSQAEYKRKYLNLQKAKGVSFGQISNLFDLMQNNKKKLNDAKKMQKDILKST